MKSPSIALVYDRVNTPFGGAELVLEALHELYPEAPLFTSLYSESQAPWAKSFKVKPSWLQRLPRWLQKHRWLAPVMPLAFESHNFDDYDIVISVTSAEAKGVLTKPHQLHLCYLLTPTRYLYSHQASYRSSNLIFQIPGLAFLANLALSYLKWWDQTAANRPDVIIAISQLVAARCQRFYHRSVANIIYPPVSQPNQALNLKNIQNTSQPYGIVISRLVDYKRIDLAIKACIAMQHPLTIVGDGPERKRLEKIANGNLLIAFHNQVSESDKIKLLAGARWLLMPGIEDFGITALEAQTLGIPVILQHQSGAAELLHDGIDSVFLTSETVENVQSAIQKISNLKHNSKLMAHNMKKYDKTIFQRQFAQQLTQTWLEYQAANSNEGKRNVRK